MLRLGGFVASAVRDNVVMEQVAGSAGALIRTLEVIDNLATPKHPIVQWISLKRFEQKNNGTSKHRIIVGGDEFEPIDEITEWDVSGMIGNKRFDVTSIATFHTFKGNRSGSGEFLINGKELKREDCGGVALEDIWAKGE
jgi:hypothetical protein